GDGGLLQYSSRPNWFVPLDSGPAGGAAGQRRLLVFDLNGDTRPELIAADVEARVVRVTRAR
ncbi:MAG: hypothetical protein AAF517_12090, partial [Planctomycetota bacterium]